MNYLIVILIISLLVILHEYGHFLAARMVKIPIKIFSIGFGPKLVGIKRKETEYRLSVFPFGGYVLPATDEKEFFQIPVSKRIIFCLGGVFFNLIVVVFLFSILNILKTGFSFNSVFINPFFQTMSCLSQFFHSFLTIFSKPEKLSGIIGIVAQGGSFIGTDIEKIVSFTIILSLNFAVFNLLPIPALDGGKILLFLLEKIHSRLVRLHLPLSIAGWLFILTIMVYTMIMDISKIFL